MPDFAYTARSLDGQKVAGKIAATTQREAVAMLTGRSLFPVDVVAEKPSARTRIRWVSGQLMATTYGQLAGLMRSGVPLLRSLSVLKEQTSNASLRTVLDEVHHRVEDGATLADAMERHPRVFSEMAINMVRAGGEGGFLEDVLDRVAQFTEQQEDLKSRTLGALAYPMFLTCVGTIVVTCLLVFFVPGFEELFDRLRERGELPMATDWLLWTSTTLQRWGIVLLIAAVVAGAYVRLQLATESGRRWADRIKLHLPLLGPVFHNLAVARFCRVLGTLLHNGVPILRSLEISRKAASNRLLSEAVGQASENISAGQSLAEPLEKSGRFPRTVVEMIAVAEESNTLEKVLVEIADGLERRTSRRLDLMVRLLEPIMLLVLACIVLVVVIALLLPILKLSSTV
jgi:general secretion pathway protein F/type IV pilus assembly protein PilC